MSHHQADPAAREEYTTRLMRAYERLKASGGGTLSARALLDGLQVDGGLLKTVEECTDWSTQTHIDQTCKKYFMCTGIVNAMCYRMVCLYACA